MISTGCAAFSPGDPPPQGFAIGKHQRRAVPASTSMVSPGGVKQQCLLIMTIYTAEPGVGIEYFCPVCYNF